MYEIEGKVWEIEDRSSKPWHLLPEDYTILTLKVDRKKVDSGYLHLTVWNKGTRAILNTRQIVGLKISCKFVLNYREKIHLIAELVSYEIIPGQEKKIDMWDDHGSLDLTTVPKKE